MGSEALGFLSEMTTMTETMKTSAARSRLTSIVKLKARTSSVKVKQQSPFVLDVMRPFAPTKGVIGQQ